MPLSKVKPQSTLNEMLFHMFPRFLKYLSLNSGKYVWSESHQEVEHTNWSSGEPWPGGEQYDCIFKSMGMDGYVEEDGWLTYFCDYDAIASSEWNYVAIHALCETNM